SPTLAPVRSRQRIAYRNAVESISLGLIAQRSTLGHGAMSRGNSVWQRREGVGSTPIWQRSLIKVIEYHIADPLRTPIGDVFAFLWPQRQQFVATNRGLKQTRVGTLEALSNKRQRKIGFNK